MDCSAAEYLELCPGIPLRSGDAQLAPICVLLTRSYMSRSLMFVLIWNHIDKINPIPDPWYLVATRPVHRITSSLRIARDSGLCPLPS